MLQVGKDRVCGFLPAVRRKRRGRRRRSKKSEQESGLNPLELCLDEA